MVQEQRPLHGFFRSVVLALAVVVSAVSGNVVGYADHNPYADNLRRVSFRDDALTDIAPFESRGKHVEFRRWSASSTLVNMCACEGPPDSILQFLDSECEAVEIYQGRLKPPTTNKEQPAGGVVKVKEGGDSDSVIFVKAFCTGTGEDVSVHLFKDENCTKRILRYSSSWENHPNPSSCDSSNTFTNYFRSPVPTCASMFRCVGYGAANLPH